MAPRTVSQSLASADTFCTAEASDWLMVKTLSVFTQEKKKDTVRHALHIYHLPNYIVDKYLLNADHNNIHLSFTSSIDTIYLLDEEKFQRLILIYDYKEPEKSFLSNL